MYYGKELTAEYRGFVIVCVPLKSHWGYRLERDGETVSVRPEGAVDAPQTLQRARQEIDTLLREGGQ